MFINSATNVKDWISRQQGEKNSSSSFLTGISTIQKEMKTYIMKLLHGMFKKKLFANILNTRACSKIM